MKNASCNRLCAFGLAFLAIATVAWVGSSFPVFGQPPGAGRAGGPARYTVIETQGHNLIVTDNSSNTLYFYTADKDKPVGSPLKLRGSVDLNNVGRPELVPTTAGAQK